MDNKLSYNCRLALTEGATRTATDIGLSYRTPYYFSYDKKETRRIPNVEIKKPFAISETYSTTYNLHYVKRPEERDLSQLLRKCKYMITQYPKIAPSMPTKFTETEYKEEYPEKSLPPTGTRGRSVEQLTTCPMITIGRDERMPLPFTDNVSRHLDIYVTTMRQDYRQYSVDEQKGIAGKNIVTVHDTMELPKGKGFGVKEPPVAGQDLDNRDPNMINDDLVGREFRARYAHIPMPIIPSGWHTEYESEFMPHTGYVKRHIFDPFVEYPERKIDSTSQNLCPPGMYFSDYDAISKHKSPQTVV